MSYYVDSLFRSDRAAALVAAAVPVAPVAATDDRAARAEAREILNASLLGKEELTMRSILLWLLGIPIPIIILIGLFSHF